MYREGPKLGKVSWYVRIGLNFFCRLAASLRVMSKRQIAILRWKSLGKVRWLARIGPNFFCRPGASLPVIRERQIANLKNPEFYPLQVGRSACASRQGPKVGKVCWYARIGPNFLCRLAASLRVICEHQIANLKYTKFHPPQVGGSACAGWQ